MADCCEWPHCGAKDGLDKDHLIPNSVVEKIGLVTVFKDDKEQKKLWQSINSATLCQRHNRNVKNDSIGIGIWLMALLKN